VKLDVGAVGTVLYGDTSSDSTAVASLLTAYGVDFEFRSVCQDSAARSEWENLDGERLPLLRVGADSLIRGVDAIRIRQAIGQVGC
jgi:hypothetical protein